MSIVSHSIVTSPQSSTRMSVTYTFTDHVGKTVAIQKLVPNNFDTNADALFMYPYIEAQQASMEVASAASIASVGMNPDRVAVYQDQADFDRRVLGVVMTVANAQLFLGSLPFYQALEVRGGANAAARAAYLGVPQTEFQLVETRFNQIMGTKVVLDADQDRVWDGLLEGWE